MNKKLFATFGLIFITFLSAIQYIFLATVPEEVSTFLFLCVTNLIGLVVMGILQGKHLKKLSFITMKKAAFLAVVNTLMNFFVVLGSRGMDSVLVASLMSMYFVFITPIMLFLRKKVNFFSAIASTIAVIALILMFGADIEALFSSPNVIFLLIADICFAVYVIGISILGENEDTSQFAMSQMFISAIIAFVCFCFELFSGNATFQLPREGSFWMSAIFIGIFIRAVYSILQIDCQKYVPPINASLIFSSEIIMTFMLNPIMSALFHIEYTPLTFFRFIGCILFIVALLIIDDTFMEKIGYSHMNEKSYVDEEGKEHTYNSVSKKIVLYAITLTVAVLIITTVICLSAIYSIRRTAVDNSTALGEKAASLSEGALEKELETQLKNTAADKADLAQEKLWSYQTATMYAASYAKSLLDNPERYEKREVHLPKLENKGSWTMQRIMADKSIPYEGIVYQESLLYGNMIDVFAPIIQNNENIATIYMGTESGLLVSYDTDSNVEEGEELYYEFRNSEWYLLAKETGKCAFTKTYQDAAGRGLTITCEAPFYDKNGKFAGCVAIDILMNDLNNKIINDGIEEPAFAELISASGDIIANKIIDPYSTKTFNVHDPGVKSYVSAVADEVLSNKEGVSKMDYSYGARYLAYANIETTGWTLCISCPVAEIIAPAISIHNSINDNTGLVVSSVIQSIASIIQTCLVLIALVLIGIVFSLGRLVTKLVNPIIQLKADVQEISEGNLEHRSTVQSDDEIGLLASSFNQMTQSLQDYIIEMTEITAKEERNAAEMSLAAEIQASSLPTAFPNTEAYEIYASMIPAKEVGGDFYDFFQIDDTHLGIVIADVSGKGVPAALFMMNSKTLIKSQCQEEVSPAKVLEAVNQQICENNKADMFVTVWLGVLDFTTGIMTCANAGHEYPVYKPNGESFALLKDKHGFVIGGMEGIPYKEYEIKLQPGDRIFVYTDGLAEATNAENEMFGVERMIMSLQRHENKPLDQILQCIKQDVDGFVKDAPQFDDLTMLCLEFKKRI